MEMSREQYLAALRPKEFEPRKSLQARVHPFNSNNRKI
jgi:hypothetical protein